VLAYTVALPNSPTDEPESIWIDHPGSAPPNLPVGTGNGVGSMAWSPDATELAFDDSVAAQPATADTPAVQPLDRVGTLSVLGGIAVTVYQLVESGIDLAGWWPQGGGLLFWEDTGFSASLEAGGLTLYSLASGSDQPVALGTSLVGPEYVAPQPGGDTVAVVAGGNRTIWTAGRDIELCSFPAATCVKERIPANTVGLDPTWSSTGTLIFSVASDTGPFGPNGTGDYSPGWMAQWNATNVLWSMADATPTPLASMPNGALLGEVNAQGKSMVFLADDAIWLTDLSGGMPAVRVTGPLYSEVAPSGFYGEVDWSSRFAWSDAVGLREGSSQEVDATFSSFTGVLP